MAKAFVLKINKKRSNIESASYMKYKTRVQRMCLFSNVNLHLSHRIVAYTRQTFCRRCSSAWVQATYFLLDLFIMPESDGCACMLQHSQEPCFADAGVSAAHCDSAGSPSHKYFLPLAEWAAFHLNQTSFSNFTNQLVFNPGEELNRC